MRVPFDSICLAAVVAECQPLVGGRVQRIVQRAPLEVDIGVYCGNEQFLFVSADAQYARAHLLTRRREGPKEPSGFCMTLRKALMDARLQFVRQRGLDRILDVGFSGKEGCFVLVAELMGKHSNIALVDADGKIVAAIKVVGRGKSKRPVLPGKPYEPPPFEPLPSLLEAKDGDDLKGFEGASPFLRKLVESGTPLGRVQDALRESRFEAVYCEGHGAYPLPLETLGLGCVKRESISQALEQHFESLVIADALAQQRNTLRKQLQRIVLARENALQSLEEALDAAARAREQQEKAELILAYQHRIDEGDDALTVTGYDRKEATIRLDPKLTPVENANRLFAKAKRAKDGAGEAAQQRARLAIEREEALAALDGLEKATTTAEVERVRGEADKRRWLHRQTVATKREERPFEGHTIRELVSPGGWRVLYGENATSNDYLTTRVARSNDYWFHVRGVTSAHVVLQTQNQPTKVQGPDLLFAATVAVQKSASKHSSYVAVDYALKKHVRKPKKSAPGFVTYSNEKTLHVEQ